MIFAVSGCSTVGEFNQRIEERASAVVYAVTEQEVPVYTNTDAAIRPQSRPVVAASVIMRENPLAVAQQYLGYNEIQDREQLTEFMGIDPVQTEWCAAFVNSVLHNVGQPGSETVSAHPLLARSFVAWGTPVDHKQQDPQPGDVVVFPRGRQSWQGHVGFYVDTVNIDGKDYWQILGGNQENSVSIDLYPAERALAVRRAPLSIPQPQQRPYWLAQATQWLVQAQQWFV